LQLYRRLSVDAALVPAYDRDFDSETTLSIEQQRGG
jgi:hypothetical protein